MPIHIYNTLTGRKEAFVPLEAGKVKMYVCGPTVYNHIHIGNARPAIFFDMVRRYLQYKGYQVYYVQNFTDIDDRIIQAAIELGKDAEEVSQMFIDSYHEHTHRLGVEQADCHPKVTENIEEIIRFIEQLIEKGLAYSSGGDVYYRTKEYPSYGKLSHQRVDELLEGVRIEVGEKKQSSLDFALWKSSKPNETAWDSPWGPGRPGWHIECSALIRKYLGESIDIHGGGADLVFPHHENEIAQSEALSGKPLAKYWMHNGMLNINNQKMSKSLGNFVRVNDVLAHHDPQIVRFFMLSGHYRNTLNYSDEMLEAAKNGFERLTNTLNSITHYLKAVPEETNERKESNKQSISDERNSTFSAKIGAWKQRFIQVMDDDFNTADAMSVLFEMAREINVGIQQNSLSNEHLIQYKDLLLELSSILGLNLMQQEEMLDDEVIRLIEERQVARKEKNFARADEIRDYLTAQGILLEDTPQGVRWRRK
jgi:cysteinyl-tRNA synthetase